MNTSAKPERLDKILSNMGRGSRSDVKKIIRSGKVSCDGIVVREPESKFIPGAVSIAIDGANLNYNKYIYLMMNKPEGVISATDDMRQRTVTDLLPDRYRTRGLFPAGRLDIDTTGLLLLTDDGDLAHRLLSPKKHIEKEYEAVLDKAPDAATIADFEQGVVIGAGSARGAVIGAGSARGAVIGTGSARGAVIGGRGLIRLKPAKLLTGLSGGAGTDSTSMGLSDSSGEVQAVLSDGGGGAQSVLSDGSGATSNGNLSSSSSTYAGTVAGYTARVIVTEGKYHQIKRMFSAHGITVLKLKRLRMGTLVLDPGLAPGGIRELTAGELESLRLLSYNNTVAVNDRHKKTNVGTDAGADAGADVGAEIDSE